VREAVEKCRAEGLEVSLFIDPDAEQVKASADLGARAVELHTGRYADAESADEMARELDALRSAGEAAVKLGLALHAGHGLNYQNVAAVARMAGMAELNIGHSIIARAVFSGLDRAVRDMRARMGVSDV
jgi:pyridoxine 5-phosphate synthase